MKESQRDLNGTFLLFTTFKFGHHTYQIFVNLFVAFLLRERMDEIKNVINMSFFVNQHIEMEILHKMLENKQKKRVTFLNTLIVIRFNILYENLQIYEKFAIF